MGVDFSGAKAAGKKIWLSVGKVKGGALSVDVCCPATALTGGNPAREAALAALRALISVSPSAVVGCDFPFGLPRSLVDATSWEAFVLGFAKRYATPEAFRAACRV